MRLQCLYPLGISCWIHASQTCHSHRLRPPRPRQPRVRLLDPVWPGRRRRHHAHRRTWQLVASNFPDQSGIFAAQAWQHTFEPKVFRKFFGEKSNMKTKLGWQTKKTLLPEVKFESNYREKNKNKTILIKYQRIKHGTIQNKFAHPKEFPQKISRKAAKPISTNWFLYPSCQYPIGYQEISRSLPLYPSSTMSTNLGTAQSPTNLSSKQFWKFLKNSLDENGFQTFFVGAKNEINQSNRIKIV